MQLTQTLLHVTHARYPRPDGRFVHGVFFMGIDVITEQVDALQLQVITPALHQLTLDDAISLHAHTNP